MSSISETYPGPQRASWASFTRTGNPCLQILRLILGLRDHHGPVLQGPTMHVINFCGLKEASETIMVQFDQPRQTMFSISDAYTLTKKTSWDSFTRSSNPCLQFNSLRLIPGLRDHHRPVLPGPAIHVFHI